MDLEGDYKAIESNSLLNGIHYCFVVVVLVKFTLLKYYRSIRILYECVRDRYCGRITALWALRG